MNTQQNDLIQAMKNEYDFPCYYPIVVFARSDTKFFALLHAALEEKQEGAKFRIRERASSRKNYIAYTVELFVETAEAALERKVFLNEFPGVLMIL